MHPEPVAKVGQCEVDDLHDPNSKTLIDSVLHSSYIDSTTRESSFVASFPNKPNIQLPEGDCHRREVTTLEKVTEEFDINLTPTNVTLSQACQ